MTYIKGVWLEMNWDLFLRTSIKTGDPQKYNVFISIKFVAAIFIMLLTETVAFLFFLLTAQYKQMENTGREKRMLCHGTKRGCCNYRCALSESIRLVVKFVTLHVKLIIF